MLGLLTLRLRMAAKPLDSEFVMQILQPAVTNLPLIGISGRLRTKLQEGAKEIITQLNLIGCNADDTNHVGGIGIPERGFAPWLVLGTAKRLRFTRLHRK